MQNVYQFAIAQYEGEHQTYYEMVEARLSDLLLARDIYGGDFDVYADHEDPDAAGIIYIDLNISQADYEAFENRA